MTRKHNKHSYQHIFKHAFGKLWVKSQQCTCPCNRVCTALSNQDSRTFQGEIMFSFSRTEKYWGSRLSHICPWYKTLGITAWESNTPCRNCTRRATPHNPENCQITFRYIFHVLHSHCHINKYEKYISRLIKQFWVMYYLEIQRLFKEFCHNSRTFQSFMQI